MNSWKVHEAQRRVLEAAASRLVAATSWLGGCAAVGSEPAVAVCPPVLEYSADFRARAAEELVLLPEGSEIDAMLGNYAVTQ